MSGTKTTAIDLVEAAYNLEVGFSSFLPNLLEAGNRFLDRGLGFGGAVFAGFAEDGTYVTTQVALSPGTPEDTLVKYAMANQEIGPEALADWVVETTGIVRKVSDDDPKWRTREIYSKHLGCKDILEINAHDHDRHGFSLFVLSDEIVHLTPHEKARLERLAVHMAAGHRLQRALAPQPDVSGSSMTDLPLDAEALLDPKRFLVSELAGGAKDAAASQTIREAAVRVDRARGKLRKSDPDEALEIWHALVRGRWSLVDWFDTDGRRFVLAKPNAPKIEDPRGLTEREAQVATYAAQGESSKILGYRFGISPPRVSKLLNSAMRKLKVETQAQLVGKLGPFAKAATPDED